MTDPGRRTLVIGLGNPLMGDDGAGLVALERLREEWDLPAEVELVDGGTWGMNLLPMIESADQLILLDALCNRATPGTVTELVGDAVPRGFDHKLSPHQIDLREVLALAMLRESLPARLVAIGVEPEAVVMQTVLSPAVAAAIPSMVTRAVDWLETLGHRCIRRAELACTS